MRTIPPTFGRRRFLRSAGVAFGWAATQCPPASGSPRFDDRRARGLLLGSWIGDALGGPIEFADPQQTAPLLLDVRAWPPSKTATEEDLQQWADSLPLLSYKKLRPEPAPYGPWLREAPPGTVTDDTRQKVVLLRAIRAVLRRDRGMLTTTDLAKAYLEFTPRVGEQPDDALRALCDEGLAEYRFAARWELGERDERRALPVERIWSGVATCAGQMLLLPLAIPYAGRPEAAYRAAYAVNWVDAPPAREMTAALIAGLAAALAPAIAAADNAARWQALLAAMRTIDPYRYQDVPFVGRPLLEWMSLAQSLAAKAGGRPARLFELLESEGNPKYWWDAHFTLLVPLAMLHFCQFNVLAALHLTLDFGHDVDSYAQVLGALGGAVCGSSLFPAEISDAVKKGMQRDYGEDVDDWVEVLNAYGKRVAIK